MKKPEVGLGLVPELAQRLPDFEDRYADMIAKDVPAQACHPDPFVGQLRGGGQPQELPHPHPLHSRAACLHHRLQAGGGNKSVLQAKGRRGSRVRGSAHRRQGHRRLKEAGEDR